MKDKPEIVFIFNGIMGGVASFNFNIINNSELIHQFHSKVILINAVEDKRVLFTEKFNADEIINFNYSYSDNQYLVLKRLNAHIGNKEGLVVLDSVLAIQAVSLFNNPKTVFHLLHDYFYVTQNNYFGSNIDVAIAHSSFFSDAVFAASPKHFGGRSFYIPYGVKQLDAFPQKNNDILKLVFLGRLDEGKGAHLLFEIEKILDEKNVNVQWTIIGKGPLKASLQTQWSNKKNCVFAAPETTAEVYAALANQDIFVFPTSFEGTPVSILECLANGVVTITNDLPGGIRDIVTEAYGYRCKLNNIEAFAESIIKLNADRNLLKKMQENCYRLAQNNYDIKKNADAYFDLFLKYKSLKRKENRSVPKLNRLDNKYLPNSIVKFIRHINK